MFLHIYYTMFGFIQTNTPFTKRIFTDYDENQQNIRYFDGSNTWNTILVHNIDLHDSNHHENIMLTMLDKYVGKISGIRDIYQNSYTKTIAITFEWWYENEFTKSLSESMDKKVKLNPNKKLYNQVEMFYTDSCYNEFNAIVEAVM
jgi:hypothetical protein